MLKVGGMILFKFRSTGVAHLHGESNACFILHHKGMISLSYMCAPTLIGIGGYRVHMSNARVGISVLLVPGLR